MTHADPQRTMAQAAMTPRQIVAIALCVLLNALDGFDVLSISFASPGIAGEWRIDRAALGVVLSIEVIGMSAGSLLLGHVADRYGRRPTVMACLAIMALGMFATTLATNIGELAATRLFTGLGIGGMLATTNALTAEYANDRWRSAAVAIMAAGYPIGAIAGGAIASQLLQTGGWRQVFFLGAGMTALFLPIVLLLPEPVAALLNSNRNDKLAAINRSLKTLGHPETKGLPPAAPQLRKPSFRELFSQGMAPVTLLLTFAYFCHFMTFYFMLKWLPKIVVDMGFSQASAAGVLVWANVGGLLGSVFFSMLSLRIALRHLLIAFMVASLFAMTLFGFSLPDLSMLSVAAAASGFCTNAVIVGFYAIVAASFPSAIRASGTGFVIGVGRGGALLGPILAGMLFDAGHALPAVAATLACGSLLAALAIVVLPGGRKA